MTHYIADLAVFGHVMGASTPWGVEVHHSDYEDHVLTQTSSYSSSFTSYLSFDGFLSTTSAYDAALNVAYDTTFGGSNRLTCTWMDTNYNWNNPTFSGRCGQSLNLAVNTVADVLHTLYQASNASNPTPSASVTPTSSQTTSSSPTASLNPSPTVPEYPFAVALALIIVATTCVTLMELKFRSMQRQHAVLSAVSTNRLNP